MSILFGLLGLAIGIPIEWKLRRRRDALVNTVKGAVTIPKDVKSKG